MIGVSEMFDADRYDNFDAEFRFSRQGLIKANHPRVTILVFVGVFAWQHVSHRSNDLSRTAEFNFAIVGKIRRNSPLIEATNFLLWITRIWNCSTVWICREWAISSCTRFFGDQGKRFIYLSGFIIYLNLVKWSLLRERDGREKGRYKNRGILSGRML